MRVSLVAAAATDSCLLQPANGCQALRVSPCRTLLPACSVTKAEVVDAIYQQTGRKVEEAELTVPEIKSVGTFECTVKLVSGVGTGACGVLMTSTACVG